MERKDLKYISSILPDLPGVYLFSDRYNKIIYIGKAKNLKKRVSSYFQGKTHSSYKLNVLVNKITKIDHFVVENESDALLLENSLIKKHQPRYNVLLKDDKTYPWICIKNERFPRVFSTRNFIKDGSEYFGPYTSMHMVRTILDLIRQLYPLRTCNYHLSEENIMGGKFKVCLEYHLGNCKGPCENLESEDEYNTSIAQIREILNGNLKEIIQILKTNMEKYAIKLKYEKAELIRQKIELLNNFQSKSTIVNPKINNLDVFSFLEENDTAYVNFIKISNGSIIQSHTIEMIRKLEESKEELLQLAIVELRKRYKSSAKEIVVPFKPEINFENLNITVPKKGDKLKLLELSTKNSRLYKNEKDKKENEIANKQQDNLILKQLKSDLRLQQLPTHIECFDNSNVQGKFPVAACVVFMNGKPKKSEYRHYNIKTVSGPNDYASMEEVIYRRYKRLLDEKQELPQLIVIDGGKGQLNAALKSLKKLNLELSIDAIGIAKKLELIYMKNDSVPLYINKNSASLRLIQQLRNEAHRFGITFHRKKRERSFLKMEFESIKGIGSVSLKKLYQKFKNIDSISHASLNELESVIKSDKAKLIWQYFHNRK